MKALRRPMIMFLAAVILAAFAQQASAQTSPPSLPILLGTTGSCKNVNQGGPCTETSTLVQLDPKTGALIREIGPVGFTVNGLAWDCTAGNCKSGTLYASTAIGDVTFHGLITIDPQTGVGTPVNTSVINFGLSGAPSPIHSITIDSNGRMVGWYDEFPPPAGVTDTFVVIDKNTGNATEFIGTGIDTSQNGLSFDNHDLLWNIDSPKCKGGPPCVITQTAYLVDPANGKPLLTKTLSPPTPAALGDFDPISKDYYGLNFEGFSPTPTFIVVVNLKKGTVTTLGQTVDNLHTLAFMKDHP